MPALNDAQVIPLYAPVVRAYHAAEDAAREIMLQISFEERALRLGKELDKSAPSGLVYQTELLLAQLQKLRAHIEEV